MDSCCCLFPPLALLLPLLARHRFLLLLLAGGLGRGRVEVEVQQDDHDGDAMAMGTVRQSIEESNEKRNFQLGADRQEIRDEHEKLLLCWGKEKKRKGQFPYGGGFLWWAKRSGAGCDP